MTKDDIKQLLMTNDRAVLRAIRALHKRQTDSEKCQGITKEHNGVGFSAFDAPILSSFAEAIQYKIDHGYTVALSHRQMEIARKRIVKYAGQLLSIANERPQVQSIADHDQPHPPYFPNAGRAVSPLQRATGVPA